MRSRPGVAAAVTAGREVVGLTSKAAVLMRMIPPEEEEEEE